MTNPSDPTFPPCRGDAPIPLRLLIALGLVTAGGWWCAYQVAVALWP